MAFRKALWLPSISYLPEDDRLGISATWYPSGSNTNMLQARSGVIQRFPIAAGGPLQVVASTGMSANILPGQMVLAGANNATQGAYLVTNDATTAVTFTASNATNPRIDVVYVQVTDANEGDASTTTGPAVQAGTPSGTPVAPVIPVGAYPLANVLIPANSSSVAGGNITDKRTWTTTLGSPVPVATAANLPPNPVDGQAAYLLDSHNAFRYYGSGWGTDGTPIFSTAALRDGALPSPRDGQHAYRTDIHAPQYYHGGVSSYVSPGQVLIARQTLGADTATVTFSSIPADFAHLRITAMVRSTAAASADILNLRFNGDSSSLYDWTTALWNDVASSGTAFTGSGGVTGGTAIRVAPQITAATEVASCFSQATIDIMHYADTTNRMKSAMGAAVSRGFTINFGFGEWIPAAAAAVTSVSLLASAGSLKAGSIISLYGIS